MYKSCKVGWIFIFVFLFSGCVKDDTGLPNVLVDFRVFLDDPKYFALNGPGGFAFIDNVGVAGVVIYNAGFYNTGFRFKAFDRASTVNPERGCAVEIDETGLSLKDPCSGAKFDLATGVPTKAPAEKSLRPYFVSGTGKVLRITN